MERSMTSTNSDSVWFKTFVAALALLSLVAAFTVGLLAYTAFELRTHVPNLLYVIVCVAVPIAIIFALYNCQSTRLTRLIAGLVVVLFAALLFLALTFTTDPQVLAQSGNALVADLPKYLDSLRNAVAISFAALGGNIAASAIVETGSSCSCSAASKVADGR